MLKIFFTLSLILTPMIVSASFMNTFNAGSPDLALGAVEQRGASTFLLRVCNIGDTSMGNSKIVAKLSSNEGALEERTYSNQSIAAGECRSLIMQAVGGYAVAPKRKSTVTATVRLSGEARELRLSNNTLKLLPRNYRVDSTSPGAKVTRSTDPVQDLWGSESSNTRWYDATETRTTYNNSNSSIYNTNNGDFDPAGPTWAMRQAAQNVIYVSNGPGSGYWYNGTVTSNGNFVYSPYSNPFISTNAYSTSGNTVFVSTNGYSNSNNSPFVSTNGYNNSANWPFISTNGYSNSGSNRPFVSTNGYNNNNNNNGPFISTNGYTNSSNSPFISTNGYSNTPSTPFVSTNLYNYTTFNPLPPDTRPNNPDSLRCDRWTLNPNTGRYEWRCNDGVWGGYGTPDLYMSNLRQNGDRNELIATVCNQWDTMGIQSQITLRIGNGTQSVTTSSFVQLGRGGCADVAMSLSNFNIFTKPQGVLFYAEIDIYNAVRESREDNNNSYWRLVIN